MASLAPERPGPNQDGDIANAADHAMQNFAYRSPLGRCPLPERYVEGQPELRVHLTFKVVLDPYLGQETEPADLCTRPQLPRRIWDEDDPGATSTSSTSLSTAPAVRRT